ncbi:MAG: beta-N-acetylhexosaminidase [Labilithrix sp.]|nr:beta-N-acetylhexosaminidase [Labilithrix sp.]MCW5814018.1 beta-N-acetylhexosaminidase [Labilithrix sp.]
MARSLAVLCGQLVVVGIGGVELAAAEATSLRSGERGGVVLFKRNVVQGELGRLVALTRSIREAAGEDALVAIDQEGGRVVRIGSPALALPPMRRIGDRGDVAFARRLAEAQAKELAALGITMSFAPVADIHTRPENPIIGDRAFGSTAEVVTRFAGAWAEGLARGQILSCLKHFPGHGDTTVDSHLALPRVERDRAGLDAIELAPFRALARHPDVHSMMTAHVVFPALDPDVPATLSRAVCTDLVRRGLGFDGVLFSDDLEMKAIAIPAGEAAVRAVGAGCDAVLVCSRADMAAEAHAALVREAETSPAFRARCEEAAARMTAMRKKLQPRPVEERELDAVFAASRAIATELG